MLPKQDSKAVLQLSDALCWSLADEFWQQHPALAVWAVFLPTFPSCLMRGHGWFMIRSFRRSRQLSTPQKSQTSANASIAEARRFGAAPASSAATDREAQRAFARFLTHGSPRRRRGRAALGRAVLARAADAAGTLPGRRLRVHPSPSKSLGDGAAESGCENHPARCDDERP